jgi:PAS domain S-box-containing protein
MATSDQSLKVLGLCGSRGLPRAVRAVLQRQEFSFDLTMADGLPDFQKQAASGLFDVGLVDFGAFPAHAADRLRILGNLNSLLPLILLGSEREEKQALKALSAGVIRDYIVKAKAQVEKLPLVLRSVAVWGSGVSMQNLVLMEAKQAAILQDAVYRIAQAAEIATSLDDLFPRIHSIVSEVMPAKNFYIALSAPRKGYVTFPYFVDEVDNASVGEQVKIGLTAYVFKIGKSFICDESMQMEMDKRGEVMRVGVPSKVWLGVPLIVDHAVIGVMVVQHYQDAHAYGERERRILEFVSSQVAHVIKKKQAEQALQASEESFRSLFENSTVGISRTTPDGHILLANPALIKMLGFASLEDLKKRNLQEEGFSAEHSRDEFRERIEAAGELNGYESTWIRKDGTSIYVRESARAVRGPEGKTLYYEGIIEDISGQKQALVSLQEKIAALQALTEIDRDILAARQAGDILELVCRSAASLLKSSMAAIISIRGGRGSVDATFGIRSPEELEAEIQEMLSSGQGFSPVSYSSNDVSLPFQMMSRTVVLEGVRSILAETLFVGKEDQSILLIFDKSPRVWTEDESNLIKILAGQAAIALDKARLLSDAQRRGDEFAALHKVSVGLSGEQDLQLVLSQIVDSIGKSLNVPCSFIYLYDEKSETLELSISRGLGYQKNLSVKLDEGIAGRVAATRQPLLVSNYHDWEHRLRQLDEIDYSAILEVPMLFSGMLIGVLGVAEISNGSRVFSEQDERLLSLFAAQAASAVYNANLFDVIRKSNQELEHLYRASDALIGAVSSNINDLSQRIAQIVVSEFRQSNCSLWLLVGDPPSMRRLSSAGATSSEIVLHPLSVDGPGLVPRVIRTGQPVNVPDVQSDPDYLEGWLSARSELVLPLKTGGRVMGALDLQSAEPSAFSAEEVRVMSQFASRASLMLEHARLVSETEQRLQRLSALHTVDIAVASSLDLQVTLKVFLGQVTSQLRVDAADVLLFNPHLQVLEYATGRGFRGTGIRRVSLRVGEDVAGQAALERKVIGVSQLDSSLGQVSHPERIAGEGFVSAYAVPLIARGEMQGVLELYFRNQFVGDMEWQNFVETLARRAAVAIDDASLFEQIQRSYTELVVAYDSTIEGWARLLELRTVEPRGHSQRVTMLVMEWARRLGVPERDLMHIYRGALLHDIGKLAIPDSVLLKAGSLTEAEWVIVRKHPVLANDLLMSIDYLRPAAVIPYAHHEKWDGSGYPRRLVGNQIPLAARIFSVADVWDSLMRDQPQRPAWSEAEATDFIRAQAGRDFDPLVVETFLSYIQEDEQRAFTRPDDTM